MSFLTTNYNDLQDKDFSPLPEGDYEVIVQSCGEQATKNGAESVHFKLVVRNDLDQALPNTNGKYHNRVLFQDEWKRKQSGQYEAKNFLYYLKAVGVPEGVSIETVDQFCAGMTGKAVKVHVIQEENTWNGNKTIRNVIKPWGWSQTAFPHIAHQFKQQDDNAQQVNQGFNQPAPAPFVSNGTANIDDDSLPF